MLRYQLGQLGVQGWQCGRQRGVGWHRGVPPGPHLAADDDGGGGGGYAKVDDIVQGHSHTLLEHCKVPLQLGNTVHGDAAAAAAAAAAADLPLAAAGDVPAAAGLQVAAAAAAVVEAAGFAAAAAVHLSAAAAMSAAAAAAAADDDDGVGGTVAVSASPVAEFAAWAGSWEWT